jgi:hypothetical protein
MRFLLAFVLCFISVFAVAQVPMAVGGPQGITVTRINAQDWMAVPIMADTPVAPLTGTGWPGRGYIVFVARPDSACNPLPATCPPRDTSLWEYTGQRWKRVGMDYLTRLVFGGQVTQNQTSKKNFAITAYSAFINGSFYRRVSTTLLTSVAKTADSTSRLDVIVIGKDGPIIKTGVPNVRPNKPVVNGDEIELTTIFFPANDTVPSATSSTNFVSSIFRIVGMDSIYYTQNNQTYALKDSIGISTSTNGLTHSDKNVKLGGSLIENTTISLPSRRLSIASSSDTTRFFSNGSVNIGGAASDSTYKLNVNGGIKTDSIIVDDLYAKFGSYTGDGSVPFAPIEFRATTGNRARIDLRPASNAGWNSNWYGAITHNGPETDILSANYGSLYLGNSFWAAGGGIYLGNTRANPSMYIRNNSNVLIGDTANTGFRFDVNGRVRLRDTLTLSTTPVTADTSANDLLVINSSNGQVRRFTGAFPSANPTLQQVTTTGNITTDSIISPVFVIDGITSDFAISEDGAGSGALAIKNRDGTYPTVRIGNQLNLRNSAGNATVLLKSSTAANYTTTLPDTTGNLSVGVAANGTTYMAGANGVINIGDLWLSGSATLDFPNTGHGNSADLTFTLTGAAEGDVVALGIPNASIVANGSFIAWVSATNTVTVRFNNYASSGSSDPASGTFKIKVLK